MFELLEEFIKRAERLGKYSNNTASGMYSALKIVVEGVADDEPSDLAYVLEHLEEIFHRQLNKLNLSQASINTYIARVKRIISDFKIYGQDTKAFHAWKPKITRRDIRSRTTTSDQVEDLGATSTGMSSIKDDGNLKNSALRTLTWSLRPNLLIQIQLPVDLNVNDVARLKKLLDLEAELTPNEIDNK